MLPSPNGNDLLDHTYAFNLSDSSQVGEARRFAQLISANANLDEVRAGRVGIIVNELGNNLVRYAQGGQLLLRRIHCGELTGIEILSVDRGPGFSTTAAMQDGFTTGATPGQGLGSVQRQADVFDIFSQYGKGSTILAQVFNGTPPKTLSFQIGVVNLPIKGEVVCGDAWAVRLEKDGIHAIVADGLGHGTAAHTAAMEAVDVFESTTAQPLATVLQALHGRLKSTRGAAVFLLTLHENSVDFVGAGNIRTLILQPGKTKTLISQNGTAGIQIRAARPMTEPCSSAGFVILHSDGLSSKGDLAAYPGVWQHHPAIVAGIMFRDFNRGSDDSTVLVIKAAP